MTTAAAPIPAVRSHPPSAAAAVDEPRVLLRNISWETYEALLRDLECSNVRLTYDRGDLEIISPSPMHEKTGKVLGRMVEHLTLELNIPLVALAHTTWKHQALAKGCEADECYYIPRATWAIGRETLIAMTSPVRTSANGPPI